MLFWKIAQRNPLYCSFTCIWPRTPLRLEAKKEEKGWKGRGGGFLFFTTVQSTTFLAFATDSQSVIKILPYFGPLFVLYVLHFAVEYCCRVYTVLLLFVIDCLSGALQTNFFIPWYGTLHSGSINQNEKKVCLGLSLVLLDGMTLAT